MNIALYTSSHGYGHTSRAHEIARGLLSIDSSTELHFMSDAPASFFLGEWHPRIHYRRKKLDIGLHQLDSLTVDITRTLEELIELYASADELIAGEAQYLTEHQIELVIGDVPPLAFEAAAAVNLPAVAVANFSWDWIYEDYLHDYPGFLRPVERIRTAYQQADRLFRLPFAGSMPAFREVVDCPLLGRRSCFSKTAARLALGIAADQPVILFSFSGTGQELQVILNRPWVVLTGDPSPVDLPDARYFSDEMLAQKKLRYCDLVAAADIVVTKLGYGILTECIANGAAILHLPRAHFREYPILEAGARQHLPVRGIDLAALADGSWTEAAQELLDQPRPVPQECPGADFIATTILTHYR